jgi:hypothetical protein
MKANARHVVTLILGILLPISARSQGPGMNLAAMRAFWKPVVGAGAAYSLEQKDLGKIEMEIAVVGTETVAGKTGYWTEQTMKDPRHGEGRSKILFVGDRNTLQIKRMITQGPDGKAAEVPADVFKGSSGEEQEEFDLLGTETIATPAGSFVCQHYRTKEKKANSEDGEGVGGTPDVKDFWLNEKVSPFGIVKMTSKDSTQILQRLITNAQPQVKGKP